MLVYHDRTLDASTNGQDCTSRTNLYRFSAVFIRLTFHEEYTGLSFYEQHVCGDQEHCRRLELSVAIRSLLVVVLSSPYSVVSRFLIRKEI